MRIVRDLFALFGLACLLYFAFTAYLGYRVGRAIAVAEQRRPMVRRGAALLGRDAIELFAVRRSGLPYYWVESPTFWLLLRNSE
jgi:uncharacterized membrane protein SpoIIM required for sporulation